MNTLFIYSLLLSCVSIIIWFCYRLTIFGINSPKFNRIILLSGIAMSIIVPMTVFIPDTLSTTGGYINQSISIGDADVTVLEYTVSDLGVLPIIRTVYLVGAVIVLSYFIVAILRLVTFLWKGERVCDGNACVIIYDDDDMVPFTWGGYIVMSRCDYEKFHDMIILHEMAHLRSYHWLDLLLANVAVVAAWYCPAVWLMRSELQTQHEYDADSAVVSYGIDINEYQSFLIKKTVGMNRLQTIIADGINNSSIKKRMKMMKTIKSSVGARMRAIVFVPLVAFIIIGLSSERVRATVKSVSGERADVGMVVETANSAVEEKVYNTSETMPKFPGGEAALLKFIGENIKYPASDINSGVRKRVVVKFVVKHDGEIGDTEIVRSGGDVFDIEAIRVVKMLPKFEPGKVDGKPVNVWYTLPITFSSM